MQAASLSQDGGTLITSTGTLKSSEGAMQAGQPYPGEVRHPVALVNLRGQGDTYPHLEPCC